MLSSLADLTLSQTPPVVITTGSCTCRSGFASDTKPCSVIPSVVGTPLSPDTPGAKRWYCGKEAISMRSNLALCHPFERGTVANFEAVEDLLTHIFYNELKVDPRMQMVMMSEVPIGPKANRERMTQIMFETFSVEALYIKLEMVLSLIASGRVTGLVVDSGSEVTRKVPIYQGYCLPHAVTRVDKGGNNVTSNLIQLLQERGYSLVTPAERDMVQGMKEKVAYVSEDFKREMSQPSCVREEEYRLPDGRVVKLGSERFRCTEFLFDPPQVTCSSEGIGSCSFSCVLKCDVDIRRDLFSNVVLSGGNSMLQGVDRRLARELKERVPVSMPVQVISPPDRDASAWYGGAILSTHSAMSGQWISKGEYDDSGPSIVHRKCF